jgi:hypothetical protein
MSLTRKLTITINLDNDAFHPDKGGPQFEVAWILRQLSDRYSNADAELTQRLRDSNGNTVGFADESIKEWKV